jgi:small-conductance mechanosensitive channel
VVVALALFALGGLLRFTRLFFESVARREASLSSLPAELARPVSSLVRGALVFAALLLVVPLISDSEHTPASRLAFVALCALGLAVVPVLASALVGGAVLLSKRFRVGDFVDFGPRAQGRVRELRVLDVVVEDDAGRTVHVPQALALWSAQAVGASYEARIDVAPDHDLHAAREVIEEAARALDVPCQAELVRVDGGAARFRLRIAAPTASAKSDVVARAVRDLRAAGISLAGQPPQAPAPLDASPEPTAPSARAE